MACLLVDVALGWCGLSVNVSLESFVLVRRCLLIDMWSDYWLAKPGLLADFCCEVMAARRPMLCFDLQY